MAVYQSTFVSPQNISINPVVNNDFTAFVQVDSSVDAYRWIVRTLSDTIVFDSAKTTLTTPLFNGELLSISIPSGTFTAGITYKHSVETFEGVLSATSAPVSFVANSLPTATITVPASVTSQSFTFTFDYSQAESIGIEYYVYEIKDSDGNTVVETERFYTGNTSYRFEGFLRGQTYSVSASGVNKRNIPFQTNTATFTVTYAQPNVNITPVVNQNRFNSVVNIKWGGILQITGTVSGGTPTYQQNFAYTGDNAINLQNGMSVEYLVDIPEVFTNYVSWRANPDFLTGSGLICRQEGDNSSFYDIGYTNGAFYFNNNGITVSGIQRLSVPSEIVEIFIFAQEIHIKIDNNVERIFVG